jgi:hypothetical protein
VIIVACAVVALLLIILTVYSVRKAPSLSKAAAPPSQEVSATKLTPSLNCWFYDFTHVRIVVGFDFAVTLSKGKPPRFDEQAEGSGDGEKTTFDSNQRPTWPYSHDEDGTPTITSPDGATRIVLYGLKLGTGGVFLIEAGVRSNRYRNLGGQCRQTNLDGGGQAENDPPP